MSHENNVADPGRVTPELLARLGAELEGGGMTAKYIRALALELATEGADANAIPNNGTSSEQSNSNKQSNVVPFKPCCAVRSDAKETASVAKVAVSLAIYQALGNSIDNFDWDIVTDTEESELDVNASVLQGFDQYNLANLLPGDS